jgi:hypothetical protein
VTSKGRLPQLAGPDRSSHWRKRPGHVAADPNFLFFTCVFSYILRHYVYFFLYFCLPGTLKELQREAHRLVTILEALHGEDAREAAATVDDSDAGEYMLDLLRRWRQNRKAVLEREIQRLRQQIAIKAGEDIKNAAGSAPGAPAAASAAAAAVAKAKPGLLEWIEHEGGLVRI